MADSTRIVFDRVSRAIWLLTTIVGPTWRVKYLPRKPECAMPPPPGSICSFWHENLLMGFYLLRGAGRTALISSSRDGERLSAVLQRWGYDLVRGSSSRGGYASTRQSIRALRSGATLVMTPDGPTGPRHEAKPGVVHLANAAGASVYPLAFSAWPSVRLRSWDRFVIPLPFARIRIRIGAPQVPSVVHGDEAMLPDLLNTISAEMHW